MEEENILIDQLEDQLIDHPVPLAMTNAPDSLFNESYQKELAERASQILNGLCGSFGDVGGPGKQENGSLYNFLLTKPILHYLHSDTNTLRQELADWFVSADLSDLSSYHAEEPLDLNTASELGFRSSLNLNKPNLHIDRLYAYVLGDFNNFYDEEEHLAQIVENNRKALNHDLFKKVLVLIRQSLQLFCENLEDFMTNPSSAMDTFGANLHKLATIVYFTISVAVEWPELPDSVLDSLREIDLLASILSLVEAWKQYPTNVIRIRDFLLLFYKLILVEFGGSKQLDKVETFLAESAQLNEKDINSNKTTHLSANTVPNISKDIHTDMNSLIRMCIQNDQLTCSPLEFFTLKEDLHDKYPLSETNLNRKKKQSHPESSLEIEREKFMAFNMFSSSVTNLLDTPRTNKAHTVMGQLPAQTLHLATPVSSPPLTPSEFMSGGEKIRKMYHVHQGMPLIYPFEQLQMVPQAVLEANKLLDQTVHNSYLFQQLYNERLAFMKQERGIENAYKVSPTEDFDPFESSVLSPLDMEKCRRSLKRVEQFYGRCMSHFQSLVTVMLCVVSSNKLDVNLRDIELEINLTYSFLLKFGSDAEISNYVKTALYRKLECIRVKETTLRAVSGSFIFLLRWLKQSHVLKSFYFGTLLLDSQFMNVFTEFLADSFNDNALQKADDENVALSSYEVLVLQNKLMNPKISLPQYDFFNFSMGQSEPPETIQLINQTPICRMDHEIEENGKRVVHINEFNADFCAVLTNLFNTTNELLIENMSQRVIMFNDTKSTDLLKIVLLNYECNDLQTPILHIVKKLTPYQGRKWRASNMDIISRIYLNLRLSLKDDWLCGKDIEGDFNSCYEQELALRSLFHFYNMRRYPEQMRCLGLAIDEE